MRKHAQNTKKHTQTSAQNYTDTQKTHKECINMQKMTQTCTKMDHFEIIQMICLLGGSFLGWACPQIAKS